MLVELWSSVVGLQVGLQAGLQAELQGGDPLGPLRTACSISLRGQYTGWAEVELLVEHWQSFVRSFVQSFCRALVELNAELLQSFGGA